MANAKRCDICGKTYGDTSEDGLRIGQQIFKNGGYWLCWTDICPECANSIREHVKKIKRGDVKDETKDNFFRRIAVFWRNRR